MSGLDEAVEAVRGSVGSPGRFSDEDCLRVIRAAAPALLKAVVAEIGVDPMEELGESFDGGGYWDDKDLPILQAALSRTLLAALTRLTAPPAEGTK